MFTRSATSGRGAMGVEAGWRSLSRQSVRPALVAAIDARVVAAFAAAILRVGAVGDREAVIRYRPVGVGAILFPASVVSAK
jgi:uncharacterized membrane-anchored protein